MRINATQRLALSVVTIGTSIIGIYYCGTPGYPLMSIGIYWFSGFMKAAREEGAPVPEPPPILFSQMAYELVDIRGQPVLNSNRFSNPGHLS